MGKRFRSSPSARRSPADGFACAAYERATVVVSGAENQIRSSSNTARHQVDTVTSPPVRVCSSSTRPVMRELPE